MKEPRGRTVFLFGAGAALPWNAPSTADITQLIRTRGFKIVGEDVYITEFIYQQLIKQGFPDNYVNFETILNVIEELIVYHSPFDGIENVPPLLESFFSQEFSEKIFNYTIKDGVTKHGYQLEIPKNTEYEYSDYAYHNQLPHQFYLQHLLRDLLNEICLLVSKYAYDSDAIPLKTAGSDVSNHFTKWMSRISQTSSLRIYTLNYDKIFKSLLTATGISVFDGFYPLTEGYDRSRANVLQIHSDQESHLYYNLHGSVYWEVEGLDKDQLPNAEFFLTRFPQMHMRREVPFSQIERGKTILLSNIVTGYQKAQRSAITPFKQMQSAFDRDCCFAEQLYIIGYSLGDEHINESIKTAVRHNPNLKITIIDRGFFENGMDLQFSQKIVPFYEGHKEYRSTIEPFISHSLLAGKIIAYSISFESFLALQNDPLQRHRVNIDG